MSSPAERDAGPRGPQEHRCSALSVKRGESMLGTGFADSGVLLVEQPGPWGHAGLRESQFAREVAVALEARAAAAGLKLLVIRRPGREVWEGRRRWAVRPAGSSEVYWSTYLADAELLTVPLDSSVGAPEAEPLYLVCTHAKRDQCCAVFGRAVALALNERRPGRVWGCSHTGGHRFAPVVLTLPNGALYGRVTDDVLDELVAATDRGDLLVDHLRGELGFAPPVQAALARARQELGLPRSDALSVTEVLADGPTTRVTLIKTAAASPGRQPPVDQRWEVIVEARREELTYVSCGKPDSKPETQYVPVSVRSVPGSP